MDSLYKFKETWYKSNIPYVLSSLLPECITLLGYDEF